jgi:hypothetical protein
MLHTLSPSYCHKPRLFGGAQLTEMHHCCQTKRLECLFIRKLAICSIRHFRCVHLSFSWSLIWQGAVSFIRHSRLTSQNVYLSKDHAAHHKRMYQYRTMALIEHGVNFQVQHT